MQSVEDDPCRMSKSETPSVPDESGIHTGLPDAPNDVNMLQMTETIINNVKLKLNKENLNFADVLNEFIGYDGNDNNYLTCFFLLIVSKLKKMENTLNHIKPDISDKLLKEIVIKYESKLI